VNGIHEVRGSIPLISTTYRAARAHLALLAFVVACGKDAPTKKQQPPVTAADALAADALAADALAANEVDAPGANGVIASDDAVEVVASDDKYVIRSRDGKVTIPFLGLPSLGSRRVDSSLVSHGFATRDQEVSAASHDDNAGTGMGVIVVKNVGKLADKDVQRLFDVVRDARVPLFDGKLTSEQRIQIADEPARQFVVDEKHGTYPQVLRQWMFYVRGQETLFIIDGTHEPDDRAAVSKLVALVGAITIAR
jgi:hypothetical protein